MERFWVLDGIFMEVNRLSCRVMVVLGGLLCLFVGYRTFLLPFLEPSISIQDPETILTNDSEHSRFQGIFPEGAWELNPNNITIEKEDLTLILQDYAIEDAGKILRGSPCTILYYPKHATEGNFASRTPLIIQIPEGIELLLDAPRTNLSFGKPIRGKLRGLVTASYAGESAAPDDDLKFQTSDLIYENGELKTSQGVLFRYGKHEGRGSDMIIKLDFPSGTDKGPLITGIKSIELQHLDHLRMVLDRSMLKEKTISPAGLFYPDGTLPVTLTCTGPLSYDVTSQKLFFNDQVRIGCQYPDTLQDFMTCDTLMLGFAELSEKEKEKDPNAVKNPVGISIQQVQASGQEVLLTSNRYACQARGTSLKLDVPEQTLRLESLEETTLVFKTQEFHGKSIEYRYSLKSGEAGSVFVNHQGWMRFVEKKSGQVVRASWRTDLKAFPNPKKKEYVIQLNGRATLDSAMFGDLSADTLSLWLTESSSPAVSESSAKESKDRLGSYVPARMQAIGNVRMKVHRPGFQIDGMLDDIVFWFTQVSQVASTRKTSNGASQIWQPTTPAVESQKNVVRSFRLQAKSLAGMLEMSPSEVRLAKVHLTGGISLSEEINYQTSDMPIQVNATEIILEDVAPETLQGSIRGEQVVLKGQGMELSGSLININCAANRVWMECPGKMKMFIRKNQENRSYNIPETVQVTWDDQLAFDGRTLEISKNVHVEHPLFLMNTDHLTGTLVEPLEFSDPPKVESGQARNLVESVRAIGNVLVKCQSVQDGKVTSLIQGGTSQMSFYPLSGDFTIPARGWMRMTSLTQPLSSPEKKAAPESSEEKKILYHTDVSFDEKATGNIDRMALQFHRNVIVVGDEVAQWEDVLSPNIDPVTLKKQGFLLHADFMQVNADPHADKETIRDTLEFLARKNVRLEMRLFSARADQLSFSVEKDRVILHGDPERVSVDYQKTIGSPHRNFTANHIEYAPTTRELKWDGMIMKEGL